MRTVDGVRLNLELSQLDLPVQLITSEQVRITDINITTGENNRGVFTLRIKLIYNILPTVFCWISELIIHDI